MLKRIRALASSASEDSPPDFGVTRAQPALGTYVGWLVEPGCAERIAAWCRDCGLDNHLDPAEFHTTIIYSPTVGLPATQEGIRPLKPIRVLPPIVTRTVERFGPVHAALVVRFAEFADAFVRHTDLVAKGLVHTYDDPARYFHLTLSYEASNVDPNVMANLARTPLPFAIVYDREKIRAIVDDSYA